MAVHWQTPPMKGGYPHAYLACSGDREYWLRKRIEDSAGGYRLLVFHRGYLVGGTNHRDLAAAKRVAEQIDSAFGQDARP